MQTNRKLIGRTNMSRIPNGAGRVPTMGGPRGEDSHLGEDSPRGKDLSIRKLTVNTHKTMYITRMAADDEAEVGEAEDDDHGQGTARVAVWYTPLRRKNLMKTPQMCYRTVLNTWPWNR